ncbi:MULTISPECIES: DUF1435 family protein [Mangrovibacter]|uniref:Uncharacterized protein DUF1435 n=1 Tax=Mangrovibacter plantisponsor TaxID=451513 RepID=A0A317Q1U2_9ENTR|nr:MULTISPECIES: DUF1435 family protein [Mangrovibacter]PWW09082.1 uncharacterized protein DUF1435 [Mangrovibacter plantisponsor]
MRKCLEGGWGLILGSGVILGLAFIGLPFSLWRVLTAVALLSTAAMLWHPRLRHFILLSSAMALGSGAVLLLKAMMTWPVFP